MTLKYLPHFIIAVLLGFITHELAHFGMGQLLGYDMFVSINKAGPSIDGTYATETHAQLVTAAGPIVTLLLAGMAFWFVYRRDARWAFPFLFFSFMMRILAAAVSIANPNDEAKISAGLGIGMWTLPLIVIGVLFGLTVLASRKLGLGWKSWVFCWVVTSVGITSVVLTEPSWPVFGR